eukprot:scaffold34247_cov51-Phaeocystis_antarctica.AAC.1
MNCCPASARARPVSSRCCRRLASSAASAACRRPCVSCSDTACTAASCTAAPLPACSGGGRKGLGSGVRVRSGVRAWKARQAEAAGSLPLALPGDVCAW